MSNNKSNREIDNVRNGVLNDFLDKYLYTDEQFSNVVRCYDKSRQLQGIDVTFIYNGIPCICDEKGATTPKYINSKYPLNTFCLELSSLQENSKLKIKVLREGWLTNDMCINDYYMFIWVDKADSSYIEDCGKDGIRKVVVCLVRKQKILDYLESLGLTKDVLRDKAMRIRNGEDTDMLDIKKYGYKFSYSTWLSEEPVNILLPRETYYKLADMHKIIEV